MGPKLVETGVPFGKQIGGGGGGGGGGYSYTRTCSELGPLPLPSLYGSPIATICPSELKETDHPE